MCLSQLVLQVLSHWPFCSALLLVQTCGVRQGTLYLELWIRSFDLAAAYLDNLGKTSSNNLILWLSSKSLQLIVQGILE